MDPVYFFVPILLVSLVRQAETFGLIFFVDGSSLDGRWPVWAGWQQSEQAPTTKELLKVMSNRESWTPFFRAFTPQTRKGVPVP